MGDSDTNGATSQPIAPTSFPQNQMDQITPHQIGDWDSETGLTSEQLMHLADSLDFEQLDWTGADLFDI